MKKVVYILIALLAFSGSVVIYYLRPLYAPVSVFEIRKNLNLYKGHEVHLKGYLQVIKEKDLTYLSISSIGKTHFDKDASLMTPVTSCLLEFPEGFIPENEELTSLIQEISSKKSDESELLAEIEAVGEIEAVKATEIINSRFPDMKLKIKKIKQISSIVTRKEITSFNK